MVNRFTAQRMQLVKPSPTAEISDRVRALELEGKAVINLGEGELDFATPDTISYAGIRAIIEHKTKYTAVSGTAELKAAIAYKFKRDNDLSVKSEEIIAGSGAKQLIFNALFATMEKGDQAIIPSPYWVSYPDMVLLTGGEPIIVPCCEEEGWKLTPQKLAQVLTEKTRWLILNSPNNPTGAVYSLQELSHLAEVLKDYPDVLIMSDDIYEPLRYRGIEFNTFAAAAPELSERTLTINGVSKSHAMTGWRLGYAAGPAWLIKAMEILQSQSTSNPSSISQAAAVIALTQPDNFFEQWRDKLEMRQQWILDAINAIDGLSAKPAEGAFYIFANCKGMLGKITPDGNVLDNDCAVSAWFLEQAHVAVLHGSAFGMPGYLRIAYAVDDGVLQEACRRLVSVCKTLSDSSKAIFKR